MSTHFIQAKKKWSRDGESTPVIRKDIAKAQTEKTTQTVCGSSIVRDETEANN